MTPAAHLERYLSTLIKSARTATVPAHAATEAAADVIVSIEHLVAQDIEAYSKRKSA